jgi:hypothetical protein
MIRSRKYKRIRDDDTERFPVWRMVVNILLLILPVAVAFWGLFELWGGFIAVVYLGGVLFYLLIIAPWVTCSLCSYFERLCPFGLGKVSAAMYSFASGNLEVGKRLAKFFWLVWYTILPAVSYIYYLKNEFTLDKLTYFIVFFVLIGLFWVNTLVCCNFGGERRICPLLTPGRK